jgi:hypothetical protein
MAAKPSDSTARTPKPSKSVPADDFENLCDTVTKKLLDKDGAALCTQIKALDFLLRKKRLDLDVQSRNEARKSGQIKALEICLEDAKRFPKVQELFQQAFEELRKALDA